MISKLHSGGIVPPKQRKAKAGSESYAQKIIKNSLDKIGVHLFRNNCGCIKDRYGHFIKYGVGNPGGSDLIGWKTITVTDEWARANKGKKVAIFTAIEVKKPGVKPRISVLQQRFIDIVKRAGGLAGVARDISEATQITDFAPGGDNT